MILVVAAFGCASSGSQTVKPLVPKRLTLERGPQWRDEIRRAIPVGMPVLDARRFLSSEGFKVIRSEDGNDDSIFVARYLKREGLLVSIAYDATVHFQDGVVTKVEGSTVGFGP